MNSPDFYVTKLGVLDLGRDGFLQDQAVGLWDDAGNLLASTSVADDDPIEQLSSAFDIFDPTVAGFRYHAIAPILLTVGANYRVGSAAGEGYVWDPINPVFGPEITYVTDRYHDNGDTSATLNFPEATDLGTFGLGYFGTNFKYDTPEPSTYGLLGAGLTLLLGLARRRVRS